MKTDSVAMTNGMPVETYSENPLSHFRKIATSRRILNSRWKRAITASMKNPST
jgi:hypothetical protein